MVDEWGSSGCSFHPYQIGTPHRPPNGGLKPPEIYDNRRQ